MSTPIIDPLDLLNKMRTMDYGKILKHLTRLRESDPKSYRAIFVLVTRSQRKAAKLI